MSASLAGDMANVSQNHKDTKKMHTKFKSAPPDIPIATAAVSARAPPSHHRQQAAHLMIVRHVQTKAPADVPQGLSCLIPLLYMNQKWTPNFITTPPRFSLTVELL